MRKISLFVVISFGLACVILLAAEGKNESKPDWSINASDIEACSCPMFCQCYFNAEPAGHHDHAGNSKHYCRFNMAYKVNSGHFHDTDLSGAMFWIAGDLGDNFGDGTTDWAVVTFDKAMTPPQREAIGAILGHMFPVKWASLTTAEGTIDWQYSKAAAVAKLDGGKSAEISLKSNPSLSGQPVVIQNLTYFGVPRNDGFVLMPNEVEAYRVGDKAFEFKGTTGFFITTDMNSNDVKPAGK